MNGRLSTLEHLIVGLAVAAIALAHWPGVGGIDPVVEAKTVFAALLVCGLALARAARLVRGGGDAEVETRSEAASRRFYPKAFAILAVSWAATGMLSLVGREGAVYWARESTLQWIFILWIALIAGLEFPRHRLGLYVLLAAISGVLVAAVGVYQYAEPEAAAEWLPYSGKLSDPRHKVFSTLGNPEYLGGYLAATMTLALGILLRSRSLMLWLVGILALALEGATLLLTGARGAWLGGIAGAGILFAFELWSRGSAGVRKLALAAVSVAIIGASLYFAYQMAPALNPDRVNLRKRAAELANPASESIRHRLMMAWVGTRLIADHPVRGVGIGRFSRAFHDELESMLDEDASGAVGDYLVLLGGRSPGHAHNDPLEFWVEMGTLGALVFMAIVALGLAGLTIGAASRDRDAWSVRCAAAACAALLVESLFSFPLHLPSRGLLFWTLFVVGAVAGFDSRANREAAERVSDPDAAPGDADEAQTA